MGGKVVVGGGEVMGILWEWQFCGDGAGNMESSAEGKMCSHGRVARASPSDIFFSFITSCRSFCRSLNADFRKVHVCSTDLHFRFVFLFTAQKPLSVLNLSVL